MSKSEKDVHPIFTRILNKVLDLLKLATEGDRNAAKAAGEAISVETDVFIRNGNRTDYRRDELAFESAKIEPLKDDPKHSAFTYSTMEGRRIDDIIFAALWFISEFIKPPVARGDVNTEGPNKGQPKMNHREGERRKWVQSLGFTLDETVGNGKRKVANGDAWAELKAELEALIPQRFVGTVKPTTAKQQLPLVAPTQFGGCTLYYNVYKSDADADKISGDVKTLRAFVAAGWTFQQDAEGRMKPLALFYRDQIVASIKSDEENVKAEERKRQREAKRLQQKLQATVAEQAGIEEHVDGETEQVAV